MRIDIITIFPKMFAPVLDESIIKRAQAKKKVSIHIHDLRDYTPDKHRKVDDRPFGGGSGMVMGAEPILRAVEAVLKSARGRAQYRRRRIIILSPRGTPLQQGIAKKLARCDHLILICGHYEGIDERVGEYLSAHEISIGDYVLTGGELPAMVLVDCVVRLLPGVLGDKNSLKFESFEGNLLEYPQYTRPAECRGLKAPAVLLSGDHKKIAEWRKNKATEYTEKKRPDIFSSRTTPAPRRGGGVSLLRKEQQ
jgi:tRNA (guanine37-N1)-methyltransferase